MRYVPILALSMMLAAPAIAGPRPLTVFAAEQIFNNSFSLRDRMAAQIRLIAAGAQHIVPSERFQPAIFKATQEFQENSGSYVDGQLDAATLQSLTQATAPLFAQWSFQEIGHPLRGRPIWFPQGMNLQPLPNNYGLTFRDPPESLEVRYNYFPGAYIDKSYYDTLDTLKSKGVKIHYSVLKDDWYVISSTSPQGIDCYRRYHTDGNGILGFTEFWNNAVANVNGERIAILMSSSLRAAMNGSPFVETAHFGNGSVALRLPNPTYSTLPSAPQSAPKALSPGDTLRVVRVAPNDVLNIRELPGAQNKIVGFIPPDAADVDFDGSRQGTWIFVRYDRAEGWIDSQFVEVVPPPLKRGRKIPDGE